MRLLHPVWLLLLVPIVIAWWQWPMPVRGLRILRAVILALLVLALAQPEIRLNDRSGVVVVVADRSRSMPADRERQQMEAVELLRKEKPRTDEIFAVSFGQYVAKEAFSGSGAFEGFKSDVGIDQSDIAGGLEAALALIPSKSSGRIVLLSDGRWTGINPALSAARAAGRGVAIDHRLMTRPPVNDLAVQQFSAPESVLPGQSYTLTGWINAPVQTSLAYELMEGTNVIASGTRHVDAGVTRLMFRDRAKFAGVQQYELRVRPTATNAPADPQPENNTARALVGVQGQRPLLHVTPHGNDSGLSKLLSRGQVTVDSRTPSACRWTIEDLSGYSAVLFENVMAGEIGTAGMELITAWVEQSGGGLMMTGGEKSYAPGGYYKSPIERILPVSMELRKEHRKLMLAIVVVLDRSGSMAAPADPGRTKMDLANLGTVAVLDLLSPLDEIGVIAVDTAPHTILNMDTVDRNRVLRQKVLGIKSMGGGIYVYEALKAASAMVMKSRAETRHIILFSDAADSEEPGAYKELLAKMREAGITVSVIGLGKRTDVDSRLLEDVAARGGGSMYFTEKAQELPRLFAQDTFTVARSTFVMNETRLKSLPLLAALGGHDDWRPPAVGGYNLTYVRPEANLALITDDEYNAPVAAYWQAGSGRVLCLTHEADGKYAGPLASWDRVGDYYSTLARWTAGTQSSLPDQMVATQEVRDGACFIQLHLDPARKKESFTGRPKVQTLRGRPGLPPAKTERQLEWAGADTLEVTVPIIGDETLLSTIVIPGLSPHTMAPVCLPYSPEFAPERPDRGRQSLANISAATGGHEIIEFDDVWNSLPERQRFYNLTLWLILGSLILFLGEVLQRRTGILSMSKRKHAVYSPIQADEQAKPTQVAKPYSFAKKSEAAAAANPTVASMGATPPIISSPSAQSALPPFLRPSTDSAAPLSDALRQARQKAQDRRGDES